jgi:uridine kinase
MESRRALVLDDLARRIAGLSLDQPIEQQPLTASPDAILIVDGTFLQRPELRDGWDLTIFLKTSDGIAEQRGMVRDAGLLGGSEAAGRLYAERYSPACDLYERLCAPASIADVVIENATSTTHASISGRTGGWCDRP